MALAVAAAAGLTGGLEPRPCSRRVVSLLLPSQCCEGRWVCVPVGVLRRAVTTSPLCACGAGSEPCAAAPGEEPSDKAACEGPVNHSEEKGRSRGFKSMPAF